MGVLGTVAPGSLGGRIRNTRPATVLQPNTGGPPSSGFDPNADPILIGDGVADHTGGVGEIAIGKDAQTGDASHTSGDGNIALGLRAQAGGFLDDDDRNIAIGTDAYAGDGGSVAVGATANVTGVNGVAVGISSQSSDDRAVAVGAAAHANHAHATALGANSHTTAANQVMLGTATDFVEIPGDSSTAPNGLVQTDTADGTRYIIQITSGALVLNPAP